MNFGAESKKKCKGQCGSSTSCNVNLILSKAGRLFLDHFVFYEFNDIDVCGQLVRVSQIHTNIANAKLVEGSKLAVTNNTSQQFLGL